MRPTRIDFLDVDTEVTLSGTQIPCEYSGDVRPGRDHHPVIEVNLRSASTALRTITRFERTITMGDSVFLMAIVSAGGTAAGVSEAHAQPLDTL